MFESFHFLHPQWLLALVPLLLVFTWLLRSKAGESDWNKVIDKHLLPVLLQQAGKTTSASKGRWLAYAPLLLGWLIAVLALADPVWEKRVIPVVQTKASRVIVLDLSRSMLIPDVKPSRLARAKFVVEDILSKAAEGQTALVVFAGDAFTVTPLTRDVDTIHSLLPALSPDLMPAQGSRADRGLLKAGELLQQAGVPHGQVLLIADGAQAGSAVKAAGKLAKHGYVVSVLGVGTTQGGPIPGLRNNGKPVVVPMQESVLQAIAQAGKGQYHHLSGTQRVDIAALLTADNPVNAEATDNAGLQQQDWKSQGPLLVLLLLPLAALAFRRGWLFSVALCVLVLGQPQAARASVWDNLWLRKDQQADKALRAGDYQRAENLASDPLRRGSAAYKKGDYQQALEDFKAAQGADAAYNRGNALAALKQYQKAIKAYDEALKLQPDMADAKHNKAKIEELLKKQQQQQKKKQQQQKQNQQQDNKKQQQKNQQGKQDQQQQKGQKAANENKQNKGNNGKQKQDEKNAFADANEKLKQDQQKKAEKQAKEQQEKQEQQEQQAKAENASSDKDKEKGKEKKEENNKQSAAAQAEQKKQDAEGQQNQQEKIEAEQLSKEEKMAAEQWLRRIPDNPGELLKRKFKYQYQQRGKHTENGAW